MDLPAISEELAKVERQISYMFPDNSNEFQKPDKVKELIRWSRQLEELTDKFKRCERNEFQKLHEVKGLIRRSTESEELTYRLKQCKRCVIDSDRVWKEVEGMDAGDSIKMLTVKKQLLTNELNSYASFKEQQAIRLAKKQVDLSDALGGVAFKDIHVDLGKSELPVISSSKLMSNSYQMPKEINQATEKAVEDTASVGAEAAVTFRPQTRQMSRTVDARNSVHGAEAAVTLRPQTRQMSRTVNARNSVHGAEAAVTLRPQTRQMSRTINARNSVHVFIKQSLLFVKKLCIEAATNPLTYMGFFILGFLLYLATREGRENELERQGFTYTCVDIPGNSELRYCSWIRYLPEEVPPT